MHTTTFQHPETGLPVHATFDEARLTFEVDEAALVSIQERGRIDKYDRDQVAATEEAILKALTGMPKRPGIAGPMSQVSLIRGDALGLRGVDLRYATTAAKVVAGGNWTAWEEVPDE